MVLSAFDYGLTETVVSRLDFRRKADVVRDLVKAISDHLTSKISERRYKRFADEMKGFIKEAEELNRFRNGVIHFRGLKDPATEKAEILASADEIEAKAHEMHDLGIIFFAQALNLRDDDGMITFVGNHDSSKGKS